MRFGIALGRLNPDRWIEVSEAADELGFDFVSMPEHLILPVMMSGSPRGDAHTPIAASLPVFDVWVYFAFLAARTTRLRFGSYVYNIGLRHPFVTARAIATLDVLSGGRVDFGVGMGWLAEEWQAVELDFHLRGRRSEESLVVCQRLWTEDIVEHHGEFFDFGPVKFEPKPVQRAIPLLFGGDAEATMRRAARFGGGWVPLGTPDADLPGRIARFHELWEEQGHSLHDVRIVRAFHRADGDDIERLSDYGVTDLVVAPWERSSNSVAALSAFARQHISIAQS
jgi:probable F420-dependent oxidoreductase